MYRKYHNKKTFIDGIKFDSKLEAERYAQLKMMEMEAFQDLGITRLSARIYELREEGYQFDETFETSKNRFGESVSYKRYRFQKETKVDKMC